jgi:hypothetical protein
MTDPTQHHDEPDELDLDREAVADLDADDAAAGEIRGGYTGACKYQTQGGWCSNVTCAPCNPTDACVKQ